VEERKKDDRMKVAKFRDKYWLLVRDLHAPKISELKKNEMKNLAHKVDNKRLNNTKIKMINNSSAKNEYHSKSLKKGYFLSGSRQSINNGKSTNILNTTEEINKKHLSKRRPKHMSESRQLKSQHQKR
jgi:hypothetical protein